MSYTELLKTNEWKAKCYDVLLRDNFVCQDCGCRGVHNNTFFPISKIKDLNYLIPVELLDGKYLNDFCVGVTSDLKEAKREPVYLVSNGLRENLYVNTMMTISPFEQPLHFITTIPLKSLLYKQYHRKTSEIQYRGYVISRYVYACQIQENISGSWASISYKNSITAIFSIDIIVGKNLYKIEFSTCNKDNLLFKCNPLHIHHNYYISGHKPWEYENNALVTLCASCHQKRHKNNDIPLYSERKQILINKLPICDRCQGSGFLPEYHYHLNGICFKCNGEGVLFCK